MLQVDGGNVPAGVGYGWREECAVSFGDDRRE